MMNVIGSHSCTLKPSTVVPGPNIGVVKWTTSLLGPKITVYSLKLQYL